jgi:hypothetical protein
MSKISPLVVALAASTILTSAAFAEQAEKAPAAKASMPSAATQTTNKAFSKLSADGLKAFREVRLARLAIFNAQTDQAKKYADDARASISKAKVDDTAFMKDEASLKPPAGMSQIPTSDAMAPNKTPTAWLPVDGGLTLGEDFVATPAKAASVTKANEQLKNGDNKKAMDTLKLSDINVAFVVDVVPLDKTVSGIDNASQLIDSGKYYEGNEALKGVEDGIRFDVADINELPKTANANADKNNSGEKSAATSGSAHETSTPSAPTTPTSK